MTDTTYQGYTVEQLEQLILFELGQTMVQVSGTAITISMLYDRFPQWVLRRKLNERQNLFTFKSRCIRKMALLIGKTGYMNYPLPSNCMDNGVISALYFDSSTSYRNLLIRDIEWMHQFQEGWLVAGNGTPQYCFMGESIGNTPTIMVSQAPSTDGINYALSPETGIIAGTLPPGTSTSIIGVATGGSTITLVDATVDFTTMGIVYGMTVQNNSDGASIATVSTITAHTITFIAVMAGGTANAFAAGNSYTILSGEYGVIVSAGGDETYLFGSQIGAVNNITVPAGNIRIDYIPYPTAFPDAGNTNQYPEIPKLYHHALAMGVVADCLATFNENSKEFKRAEWYEKKFQEYFAAGAGQASRRPFDNKPVSLIPSKRRGAIR